jgi:hypothetical protein
MFRYPIIKRRIAWLIGKWISSQCSTANNPAVWEVLVHLLRDRGQGTDAVVRHTAAVALKECVDVGCFPSDGRCALTRCIAIDGRLQHRDILASAAGSSN